MLLLCDLPARVFNTVEIAQNFADSINDDEWDYKVIPDPKGSGRAIIKVYDEDGEFISNWTIDS